jgi:hypothetical protein
MDDLTSIEQKEVDFQDRKVTAVLVQDADGRENIYVPLRPLIEGMGLDWSAQYRRVKENIVLDEVCTSVAVTTTQVRHMLSIPISHLNGFLFNISAKRVKKEIRPLIIAYQRECYRVLFEAFNGIESMIRFYRAIGHEEPWIEKRIKKHETSTDVNDVWLIHGVPIEHHNQLRDVLHSETFGLTTAKHKALKQIPDDATLPDNMTRLELMISTISDEAVIELSKNNNPQTLEDNQIIANVAGKFGRKTLKGFEETTGSTVLSPSNNLNKKKQPLLPGGGKLLYFDKPHLTNDQAVYNEQLQAIDTIPHDQTIQNGESAIVWIRNRFRIAVNRVNFTEGKNYIAVEIVV